ncbi:hypothetical protein AGR7B_Cc10413 [Agrobacterium deltaense RV3]|nr:hypothetical protein AGR7B_Cc10413 [Agrobacterium deltaense RV3]
MKMNATERTRISAVVNFRLSLSKSASVDKFDNPKLL